MMIRNRTLHTLHQPSPRPLAGVALAAVIAAAVSGCGAQSADDGAAAPSPAVSTGTAAAPPAVPSTASTPVEATPGSVPIMAPDEFTTELLQLHDQLRTDLGDRYADAWIEGGVLHIGVTDASAEATVRDAGAVPVTVPFNAGELGQARTQVQTWLAGKPVPGVEFHSISASGRAGAVTVTVPPEQVPALQAAADEQSPAGKIPVIVEESAGMARPLPTK
ncbi:hypothetical protein GD627_01400 [Arthrobacter yangruifuii]|uniref:Lipoprotein n=1 Tax=Arthrobacter yangruifuii TaxID=2606616 RepID=A0A5N6MUJ8_9MICC|nr:hypothetical protein [Arthrobacter yangruifuii]KAD4059778.1 hypothetical protein GD627_01400 [Arthrobacter yangruifuii]